MTETTQDLLARLTGFTPGPWESIIDDCGQLAGRPGVSASADLDCSIVHWDGFVQHYWRSARGDKEIHANAALIAAAPDLHRIATEQAVEIERLREALEDAKYDLAQWVECAPELIKAGFNVDGTVDVLAKVSAALQVQP